MLHFVNFFERVRIGILYLELDARNKLIKMFLDKSQPGYVLSMFLKFWSISVSTFLFYKKGSYKKKN